jgi:hypothetical protein
MKNIPELNALFNTEPMTKESLPIPMDKPGLSMDQQDDFDLARQTLRRVILKGQDVLDDISELSRNSEHPRNYEVTGQIMKALSDTAKDLLELQKRAQALKTPDTAEKPAGSIGTQNNVVFAGSTTELLKLLRNEKSI